MKLKRLFNGPIIDTTSHESLGANINGPSLIRVPDWIKNKLGKYYLYFSHHHGSFIRMAYADQLEGPWTVYEPGVLPLSQTHVIDHLASPDVHIDPINRRIVMYYHGVGAWGVHTQRTHVALSRDGLDFKSLAPALGPSYFRVFGHGTWTYALSKSADAGQIFRSQTGFDCFETGPYLFEKMRHCAVRYLDSDRLEILMTKIGDCPERLFRTELDLNEPWTKWACTELEEVLRPEFPWEGSECEQIPSTSGAAHQPAYQLRDPAFFEEEGKVYILYSVAGEQGIAMALCCD